MAIRFRSAIRLVQARTIGRARRQILEAQWIAEPITDGGNAGMPRVWQQRAKPLIALGPDLATITAYRFEMQRKARFFQS
jgi:hypothetical protein